MTDETGIFTLRQHIGEGEFGEFKVELSVCLPTYSPYVSIGGRDYIVNIHEIVKAIAKKAIESGELEVSTNDRS